MLMELEHTITEANGECDQFIVSDGLLYSAKGCTTSDSAIAVFKEDWMMYFPESGSLSSSKTYGGPNYYGGYSITFHKNDALLRLRKTC